MIPSLEHLINQFSKLPGIGKKTAQRLAFHVLKSDESYATEFARALSEVKQNVRFCDNCHHISEHPLCDICSDNRRKDELICVVSEFTDIVAIEKTNEYRGKYHVLGGVLSPLDGIGPDKLNIASLKSRVATGNIQEIIFALTPNTEGEATVTYLSRILHEFPVHLTRIARGVPLGTNLEFIDQATLSRAFSGRSHIE